MVEAGLSDVDRGAVACLNQQDWRRLGRFVHNDVRRNGKPFGLANSRAMLERDFEAIPDLRFDIRLLVSEPPDLASRLVFDCTPKGTFLGLPVNGRRVSFAENAFTKFRNDKIVQVWSVIVRSAIGVQL